uniref:Secretin N-terminal domain-containing protein n=1 Tax=Desertifilum tharense IPPAS B-1220 TaxID=1781255 RepID=A0ACD5GVA4_9CYAN
MVRALLLAAVKVPLRGLSTKAVASPCGGLQMLELLGANGGGTEQAQAAAAPGANYNLLRGLQVTADGRTNSITLLGPPRLVDIATSYLRQHDVRQRQVAVNVRIVEVNLLNQDNVGASFSFGIADSFFSVDQGQLTYQLWSSSTAQHHNRQNQPVWASDR